MVVCAPSTVVLVKILKIFTAAWIHWCWCRHRSDCTTPGCREKTLTPVPAMHTAAVLTHLNFWSLLSFFLYFIQMRNECWSNSDSSFWEETCTKSDFSLSFLTATVPDNFLNSNTFLPSEMCVSSWSFHKTRPHLPTALLESVQTGR